MAVMDAVQNQTEIPTPEEVAAVDVTAGSKLSLQQQLWIDYKAIGGLIFEDAGEHFDRSGNPTQFRKMTVDEFAAKIDTAKSTLYEWQKNINNFWGMVDERRKVLMGGNRKTAVYNGLTLRAVRGEPNAVKLWAEIFDGYQPAPQRLQHSLGDGFADVMKVAQARREAIEGKVVDEPTAN